MEKSLVGSREGGVDVAPAHLGRQLCREPREVAERLGRGVGASNALKGLADAVVRKLESLARDIGRRDAGNVLGLCAGNCLSPWSKGTATYGSQTSTPPRGPTVWPSDIFWTAFLDSPALPLLS